MSESERRQRRGAAGEQRRAFAAGDSAPLLDEDAGVNYPAPAHGFALWLDDELALRLFEPHDAPELHRQVAADRDHLGRWVPWVMEATPQSVAALIAGELEAFAAGRRWRAELCHRGRSAGMVWLNENDGRGGSVEVGYCVWSGFQGRGLVTRALTELRRHLFVERGVDRFSVGLDVRNERSLGVVRRLGLQPEAVLRRVIVVDGEPADLSLFGVMRDEVEEDGGGAAPGRPPRFALAVDRKDELYLALPEEEDGAELHALVAANRDRLVPWMPWARDPSPDSERRFIVERALPSFAAGSGLEATVWRGGRIVGMVGVHDVDPRSRSGAVGYWVDSAHEGAGVIARAVTALADRCFMAPVVAGAPFERLEVMADVSNTRSRAVPERLGFTFEGVLRRQDVGGYRPDVAIYSMLRSEWEERRAVAAEPA